MTDTSTGFLPAPTRALQGILCIELGMLFFVVQDGLMKSLLQSYPIWMLISIRGIVAATVLVPTIMILGGPHRLLSPSGRCISRAPPCSRLDSAFSTPPFPS